MEAARGWKRRKGIHCNYYKAAMKVIFANAMAEDDTGFLRLLADASYNP